jgi:hypothetical protein
MSVKPYFQFKNTCDIELNELKVLIELNKLEVLIELNKLEVFIKLNKLEVPLSTLEVPWEFTEPTKSAVKYG